MINQGVVAFAVTLAAFTVAGVSYADAQTPCPNCGRVHRLYATPQGGQVYSPAAANDGLSLLNQQRAQKGLGALIPNRSLMDGALSKASRAASRGYKNHLGGSQYGAKYEGVGFNSQRAFNSCYAYTAPAGTPVGAATVKGRDGYYSCLLVDHSGPLASGQGGPVRRVGGRMRIGFFRRR